VGKMSVLKSLCSLHVVSRLHLVSIPFAHCVTILPYQANRNEIGHVSNHAVSLLLGSTNDFAKLTMQYFHSYLRREPTCW
jgi:hypothetical protein